MNITYNSAEMYSYLSSITSKNIAFQLHLFETKQNIILLYFLMQLDASLNLEQPFLFDHVLPI